MRILIFLEYFLADWYFEQEQKFTNIIKTMTHIKINILLVNILL